MAHLAVALFLLVVAGWGNGGAWEVMTKGEIEGAGFISLSLASLPIFGCWGCLSSTTHPRVYRDAVVGLGGAVSGGGDFVETRVCVGEGG